MEIKRYTVALIECGRYCEDNETIEMREGILKEHLLRVLDEFLTHERWSAGNTLIEITESTL
jgi:hypothetical protein